ncbi:MAG TPA: hypothetical protein PLY78_03775 [Methanospirillum sp.]|mgnify:FL=1|nr:hypothetical protein [Methanospirillum sp.]
MSIFIAYQVMGGERIKKYCPHQSFTIVEIGELKKAALIKMQRQMGDLTRKNGIATHGLLIQPILLPGMEE